MKYAEAYNMIGEFEQEIVNAMKPGEAVELSTIKEKTEFQYNELNYYIRKLISHGIIEKTHRGVYVLKLAK